MSALRSLLTPLRRAAARFAVDDRARHESLIGEFGCVRAAASHAAWNQLPGDYLEFGTWRGDSFIEAWHAITQARTVVERFNTKLGPDDPFWEWSRVRPRFWAFDSFAGLPPGEAERHADYAAGSYACSEAEFMTNVLNRGVERRAVVTVPGFFDQSLTENTRRHIGISSAAIVLIDCDLYESTVPVLEFITPLVQQGTILIFHDWYRFRGSRLHGERRACEEWLARHGSITLEDWWQQGPQCKAFLVHRSGH